MPPQHTDTAAYDDVLIDTDYPILQLLDREGRGTPGYIATEIGENQPNVSKRLSVLVDEGLVEKVHHALYELNDGVPTEVIYE